MNTHVEGAKALIKKQIAERNVFQMRHYTHRTKNGFALEHNAHLRTALEELGKERAVHIISRRPFGRIFDDGVKISGVNIVAVSNNLKQFDVEGL